MSSPLQQYCAEIMNFKICSVFFTLLDLFAATHCDPYFVDACPDLAATFVGVVDKTVEDLNILSDDPEQTFFREIMGFRDSDILHVLQDAVKLFNTTFGLDFSLSSPNDNNELRMQK